MLHDYRYFALNIRRLRIEAGVRQLDVAEAAGWPQPTVSVLERGLRPTAAEIQRLAEVFNVTPESLMRRPRRLPASLVRRGDAA